jgi:hypothetical protein
VLATPGSMPRTITCTTVILRGGPDAFPCAVLGRTSTALGKEVRERSVFADCGQVGTVLHAIARSIVPTLFWSDFAGTPPTLPLPYEQCRYGAPRNSDASDACKHAVGAQDPGNDDPAKPKNQTPNPTSARPTDTIITVSSTPRLRVEPRSPRIERIHGACWGR